MRFTFDVAKCDRIFDYFLQEKQIKLPSNYLILMLLMIVIFSVIRFNQS
jgi:hypothetical protein